jgi:hypothetical protein
MNPPAIKKEDRVTLQFSGRTVPGTVVLASRNSKSLLVTADAIIHGFVGMAPLLWNGETYETIAGGYVAVTLGN